MSTSNDNLFQGLQTLSQSAFPRKCEECGRKYETINDILTITDDNKEAASDNLQLRADEKGTSYLELTLQCVCGSKLKSEFGDRRDTSEAGLRRRKNFSDVLDFLTEKGFHHDDARNELLKLMRGEKSEALTPYLASTPNKTRQAD